MTIQPNPRRSGAPSILRRTMAVKHPHRRPRLPFSLGRYSVGDEENEHEATAPSTSYSVLSTFEVKIFKPRQRPRMWGGGSTSSPSPQVTQAQTTSCGKRSFGRDDPSLGAGVDGRPSRSNKHARTTSSTPTSSPLRSTSTKSSASSNKTHSVRFAPTIVSEVRTRPYTPTEDKALLFYNRRDELRFREERRRQQDEEDSDDEEDDEDDIDDECSVDSISTTEDETSDEEESDSHDDEVPPTRQHLLPTAVASVVPANLSAPRSPCPGTSSAGPIEHGSFVYAY